MNWLAVLAGFGATLLLLVLLGAAFIAGVMIGFSVGERTR